MIDKFNLDFEDLVAMQEEHLKVWRRKLIVSVHVPVTNYVREHNRVAPTAHDRHQVFRGQDLIEIIRLWPEPEKSGYPPIKAEEPKKPGEDCI